MKSDYKKLLTFIISIMVIFLTVIAFSVYKIFSINMITSDEFIYWGCFKTAAVILSISLITMLCILIITLICKKKNVKAKKVMFLLTTLVILVSVIITAIFSVNSYKDSAVENITDGDGLPEIYNNLIYFSDSDISYNIKKIENSEAKINIVNLKDDDKELSYYEIETVNPVLPYLFEINLMGFGSETSKISTGFNNDAVNPEKKIEGLDYYIYETELYYVYDQIPSHSQSEIYAKVNKSSDYTMQDFESDILKIR